MIIQKALNNLNSIEDKIPIWAEDAILKNRGVIVNLVKFDQLSKGLNSYNLPLAWSKGTGFYAKATQSFANRDGVRIPKTEGTPYNFSWSGETLDNMKLESVDEKNAKYEITTIQGKQQLLEGVYGEIFDLTEEHNTWVNENIIEPYLSQKISESLGNF